MPFKKNKKRCAAGLAAAWLACSWLFPQTLFRDCVRAVFPQNEEKETENYLNEEDYVSLFSFEKSKYKIVWKLMQNN